MRFGVDQHPGDLVRIVGQVVDDHRHEALAQRALDRAALQIGGETVAFHGLGLSAGDRLTVGHTAAGLRTAAVIRAGVDGVLVPDGDREAYAVRLMELMEDEPRRLEMAREAMLHARDYSREKVAGIWDTVLEP